MPRRKPINDPVELRAQEALLEVLNSDLHRLTTAVVKKERSIAECKAKIAKLKEVEEKEP